MLKDFPGALKNISELLKDFSGKLKDFFQVLKDFRGSRTIFWSWRIFYGMCIICQEC